jgi:hypothetical protein
MDMALVFETGIIVGSNPTGGTKKTCSDCKTIKVLSEFPFKNRKLNKVQSYCKDCQKVRSKAHYELNKQSYIDRAAVNRQKIKDYITELKEAGACFDCGRSYPARAMDYHHPDDNKERNVSNSSQWGLSAVESEIAKCVLLCAICHRLRH